MQVPRKEYQVAITWCRTQAKQLLGRRAVISNVFSSFVWTRERPMWTFNEYPPQADVRSFIYEMHQDSTDGIVIYENKSWQYLEVF
jgi:hypothetical protein